ncbi:hypothetical protein F4859DRAFT_486114 [Xylaria cf. heliscus]|nr:hypothetical protein F4859DRAFT_486114 [Xylaria cf. heliscus]
MANSTEYDPATYWHAPARNFRSSARLHLQHYLGQNTLGHLLDPRIEASVGASKPFAVADLGCGNGAWLIDLERDLAKKGLSARLDGFDINSVNFPASAFLPESVTLKKLDVLSAVPEEMKGTYDVVHIRAFVSIIVHSNVTPLLSAASELLKPGGWIQWEESLAEKFRVEAPTPDVSTTMCETIAQMLKAAGEARGLRFGFVEHLDQKLKEHSFEEVSMSAHKKLKQDFKAWTDDHLMVWEELWVHFPPKATAPQAPMNREMWMDMFIGAVKETENGVVIHHGEIISAIGRKPL